MTDPDHATEPSGDGIQRFSFRDLDIRGELAHLDATWTEVCAAHDYPLQVQRLLGELLTATALLANTIKVDGTLTVQATGDGPVPVLMAECRNRSTLRGIARIHGEMDGALPAEGAPMDTSLIGSGLLTITIRPDGGEPYQGIVPLSGTTVAEAVEGYFEQSEQIPTKLLLSADDGRAAGLLLQAMPPEFRDAERAPGERREDFRRVCILAGTLGGEELRVTGNEALLTRLFHEEQVLVEPPSPVAFRCSCNRDRTREALRAMRRSELEQIVEEEGEIEMDCQFCHTVHRFDGIDLEILFRDDPVDPGDPPPGATH